MHHPAAVGCLNRAGSGAGTNSTPDGLTLYWTEAGSAEGAAGVRIGA
jgi:hypothetical protein